MKQVMRCLGAGLLVAAGVLAFMGWGLPDVLSSALGAAIGMTLITLGLNTLFGSTYDPEGLELEHRVPEEQPVQHIAIIEMPPSIAFEEPHPPVPVPAKQKAA